MFAAINIFAEETNIVDSAPTIVLDSKPAEIVDVKPLVAPPAKWIMPLNFERLSKQTKVDPAEEWRWLLWEQQINAKENERFIHFARQILSASGVQKGSLISIDFDPSYQTLTLHSVKVWRGTNSLDRLDRDKIKMIQQERELDEYLFNGEQTAVLVLDDVRVGDIVDCSYTISGANPVFGGKYSGSVPAQFSQPVERLLTRVLWPAQRQIRTRNHGTTAKAAVVRKGEFVEFVWDFRKVAGLPSEGSLPVWFNPAPWIQLSEFQSWAEVNQWAMQLFSSKSSLSPEFMQKINEWRRVVAKEDRVLAVLHFLQDEVRYLGMEIGTGSHQPADPSTVFGRRFGDCKDKTLLFVTAMRALGIEAYPVLVNTRLRHTIDTWHPSAPFNHAIVQVKLGNQTYWLDPTDSYQRGPLAAHYYPDYQRGLVVRQGTASLTAIPQSTALPKTTVTQYFTVRGKKEPADLKIVTVAEGLDAERLREEFATTPRDEIEKNYLNYQAVTYSTIRRTSAIRFVDDERQNKVELTEFYVIDQFWSYYTDDKIYRCNFSPYNIHALLRKPSVSFRTMPLGRQYPAHQVFRAEIMLPETWPVKTRNRTVQDPAFYFQCDTQISGRKLVLNYQYRSLADAVPANQVGNYLRNVDEADKLTGESLTWR